MSSQLYFTLLFRSLLVVLGVFTATLSLFLFHVFVLLVLDVSLISTSMDYFVCLSAGIS